MITHEESVATPTDKDATIWRYMDLPKLVSLLDTEALWFGRADLQNDPLEGAYGSAVGDSLRKDIAVVSPDGETGEAFLKHIEQAVEMNRLIHFLNCWHMSECESMAMWGLYTAQGQGVAVKSSYSRLEESLESCPEPVSLGQVTYEDLTKFMPDFTASLSPRYLFFVKRKSFAHEREVRAVYSRSDLMGEVNQQMESVKDAQAAGLDSSLVHLSMLEVLHRVMGKGHPVHVSVADLIEAVYVAPGQPEWFYDAVKSVVAKFSPPGVSIPVHQSSLNSKDLL